MTPQRLAACLAACDWTQRGLARRLGYNERAVRQWLEGRAKVPLDVAAWLERTTRRIENNPPPVRNNKPPERG